MGGSFAMWAFLFSAVDCGLIYIRRKDDPINSIIAGGATGYLLAIRGGVKTALKNAAIGMTLLGCIEGFGIAMNAKNAKQANAQQNLIMNQVERTGTFQRAAAKKNTNNLRLPYVNINSTQDDFIPNEAYRKEMIRSKQKKQYESELIKE